MNKPLGVILCAMGLIGLVWGGITYHSQQTVFAIGSLHATREASHTVAFPPIAGALALIVGIWLLAGRGKSG